jgi:septum formation protein
MNRLVLASASPRRAELLRQIGVAFDVCAADIDETRMLNESPYSYVLRMARQKAEAVAPRFAGAIILASDTSVVIDGDVLGKPQNHADAHGMLRRLAGRSHQVMTSVCVLAEACQLVVNQTEVWFRDMSDAEIDAYWHTGEPIDKAGAYAIQGLGAKFVERIDGSYSGVMGLPLFEVANMLAAAGVMESGE